MAAKEAPAVNVSEERSKALKLAIEKIEKALGFYKKKEVYVWE